MEKTLKYALGSDSRFIHFHPSDDDQIFSYWNPSYGFSYRFFPRSSDGAEARSLVGHGVFHYFELYAMLLCGFGCVRPGVALVDGRHLERQQMPQRNDRDVDL